MTKLFKPQYLIGYLSLTYILLTRTVKSIVSCISTGSAKLDLLYHSKKKVRSFAKKKKKKLIKQRKFDKEVTRQHSTNMYGKMSELRLPFTKHFFDRERS